MTDTLTPTPIGRGSATEREISQQPEVWREAADIVMSRRAEIDAFLAPLLASPDLRIVLTGAGTSAFVGEVAAPTLSRRLARRFEAIATTDLVSDPLGLLQSDSPTLLVSFARSGNSPESLTATALADQVLDHVHHLVITCDPAGELFMAHDGKDGSFVVITPSRTNDEGFAMTSSFSSMLLTALLVFLGDDETAVAAVAVAAGSVLDSRDRVQALVARSPDRVVYLGSGPLRGLAQESALKILEITAGRVDTYFNSALGFRHGPKAVLNDRTLVIVYISNDAYTRQYDQDIARELRAAIGEDAVLTLHAGAAAGPTDWALPGVDELDDAYLALPMVVFAQLFGLHASVQGGIAPDNPFPGGSINRVVQGVTIHPLAVRP